MTLRSHILAATALASAVVAPSFAYAQTRGTTIEELVVTAEKREQNLQDVPVAISAYTSEKRDLIGILSIQDISNFTPGLQYSSQLDRISLRGVGRLTNVQAADPGVATYSDGVYTSSTVEAGKTPIFVDRVEVLRGPQGTLYGRNSIGGAINVLSKRPTEELYAEIRGTVGNYGRTLVEGAVSGAVAPGLRLRFAGNWERQTEGYFQNVVPGQPEAGNVIDTKFFEFQVDANIGEHLDVWAKLSFAEWDNGSGGPGARASYTPAPYNTSEVPPAAFFVNAFYGFSPNVTGLVSLGPTTRPDLTDPRKFASDTPEKISLDDTAVLATQWTYHFANMDLKYIGGGTTYKYNLIQDNDNGAVQAFRLPVNPFNPALPVAAQPCPATNAAAPGACPGLLIKPQIFSSYTEDKHWLSHEFNLSSSDDSPFQWLVGAYFYHEAYKQPVFTQFVSQTELANVLNGPRNPTLRPYDTRPELQDKSYAGFGQIDWEFAEHWKTTVGLRYSHDHKYGQESARIICFALAGCGTNPEALGSFLTGSIDITAAVAATGRNPDGSLKQGIGAATVIDPSTGFATRKLDAEWQATTGTAGVQWTPDSDTMAYARYSRGYKAGGFNTGITALIVADPYTGPEHANAYEVGLKKTFGRTLQANMAVFYYNYTNYQAPVTIVPTSGALATTQSIFLNVPKAVSQGFELETIWSPIDNLQVLFNYAYLDA
ncbi:MAG: TonB-dependent receptor, partial [Phenylobacterium sp.]